LKGADMTKSIAAIFDTRNDGEQAVQALLKQKIAAERIRLIAGNAPEQAERTKQAGADEAAGAVAAGGAVGLAGLSSLVLPGIGTLLTAGAAIASANAFAAGADDSDQDTSTPEQMLERIGLMKAQASTYAQDLQQGYTLLVVEADDEQTDRIADVLHQHGGSKLDFRQRDAEPA
ncbi:MAG TPA: hypothetical protein VFU22_15050, partial [Roseiflexaceae bacterium]|nr:hypothetical protein [Roseiflexaceae bacterium]